MKGTVFPRPHVVDPKTGAKRPTKNSTWTYAFSVPKAGGGRRQITKGGYLTRKACEEALSEALVAHGRSPMPKVQPSKQALSTYLTDEWLPALHDLKPSTRKGYADLVAAYIVPHLGDVRLCDLTSAQVVKFYDTLRTSGRRRPSKANPDDRSLSESTVHHVHVCLSAAMAHAGEARLIEVNPLASLPRRARPKATSGDKPELKAWTAEQARAFLAVADEDRLAALFELALATGLRRGELVALRWEDIDLERSVLAVRRNSVTVGYAVQDGTPKSSRARTVDLDAGTVAAIRAHRKRQLEERMAWGEAWQDHGLVFTREDGTPLHPQTVRWHLGRLARAAKVPDVGVHGLRHTHATMGLAAGVPPKVMQERLGHASVQITIDLYSHVIPGMQADAASRIGALLRGSA
jgi:integrase